MMSCSYLQDRAYGTECALFFTSQEVIWLLSAARKQDQILKPKLHQFIFEARAFKVVFFALSNTGLSNKKFHFLGTSGYRPDTAHEFGCGAKVKPCTKVTREQDSEDTWLHNLIFLPIVVLFFWNSLVQLVNKTPKQLNIPTEIPTRKNAPRTTRQLCLESFCIARIVVHFGRKFVVLILYFRKFFSATYTSITGWKAFIYYGRAGKSIVHSIAYFIVYL